MKLWRCMNCLGDNGLPGLDFHNATGVCPGCKIDGADPAYKDLIVRRTVIHFDPPHGVLRNRGTHKRACDGQSTFIPGAASDPGFGSTGAPDAVTCPDCRATAAWKKAADAAGVPRVPDEADHVIPPDAEPLPEPKARKGK